ncbi:MAG: outer membrane protein assembly factor BamE [Pseudomonadota bacterium]
MPPPNSSLRSLRVCCPLTLVAVLGLSLSACSSLTGRTQDALTAITPYQVEVVQGNVVSSEQIDALKVGMSRQQVREIVGTSLLTDMFHADRWDYVFTIDRQGVARQRLGLALFFDGDALSRIVADRMPSEQDFVAMLDPRRHIAKVPRLEASEDELRKFPPAARAAAPNANAPLPTSYPPLESKP